MQHALLRRGPIAGRWLGPHAVRKHAGDGAGETRARLTRPLRGMYVTAAVIHLKLHLFIVIVRFLDRSNAFCNCGQRFSHRSALSRLNRSDRMGGLPVLVGGLAASALLGCGLLLARGRRRRGPTVVRARGSLATAHRDAISVVSYNILVGAGPAARARMKAEEAGGTLDGTSGGMHTQHEQARRLECRPMRCAGAPRARFLPEEQQLRAAGGCLHPGRPPAPPHARDRGRPDRKGSMRP